METSCCMLQTEPRVLYIDIDLCNIFLIFSLSKQDGMEIVMFS